MSMYVTVLMLMRVYQQWQWPLIDFHPFLSRGVILILLACVHACYHMTIPPSILNVHQHVSVSVPYLMSMSIIGTWHCSSLSFGCSTNVVWLQASIVVSLFTHIFLCFTSDHTLVLTLDLLHYCHLFIMLCYFPLPLLAHSVPSCTLSMYCSGRLSSFSTRVVIFYRVIDRYTLFVALSFCSLTNLRDACPFRCSHNNQSIINSVISLCSCSPVDV
jgi:hypothetical protein